MTTQTEVKYRRKIRVTEKGYDEARAFVGMTTRMHKRLKYDGGFTYYILDEAETQIIRFNREKRTIEISDKVDPELVDLIEHTVMAEIEVLIG